MVEGAVVSVFLRGGMSACLLLGVGVVEGHGPGGDALNQTGDEVGCCRLVLVELGEVLVDRAERCLDALDLRRRKLGTSQVFHSVLPQAVDGRGQCARADPSASRAGSQDPARGRDDRAAGLIDNRLRRVGGENDVTWLCVDCRAIAVCLNQTVDPPGFAAFSGDDPYRACGVEILVRNSAPLWRTTSPASTSSPSDRVALGDVVPTRASGTSKPGMGSRVTSVARTNRSCCRRRCERSHGLRADTERNDGVPGPHSGVRKARP